MAMASGLWDRKLNRQAGELFQRTVFERGKRRAISWMLAGIFRATDNRRNRSIITYWGIPDISFSLVYIGKPDMLSDDGVALSSL